MKTVRLSEMHSRGSDQEFLHICFHTFCRRVIYISCLHNTVDGLSQRWDVMPLCHQTAQVVGSLHPSASRCHLVIITPLLDIWIFVLFYLHACHRHTHFWFCGCVSIRNGETVGFDPGQRNAATSLQIKLIWIDTDD